MNQPIGMISPCIGLCELDNQKVCLGCLRTIEEITSWSSMPASRRLAVMQDLIARRRSRGAALTATPNDTKDEADGSAR